MQGVYLLSSSAYSRGFDGTYNEWDTKDEYKSHFFMYIVGIGIEYQINKVTLFIEPEYARSTRDVGNVSGSYKSYRIEQYSINIGLKL